ncbi:hypothetical protein D3C77_553770 [compost metagenome]
MFFKAVGFHHVFNGTALLGNFQFAITIGALEGDMQVGEECVFLRIVEAQLFRKDQGATG